MSEKVVIRENIDRHMAEIKKFLAETENEKLEKMPDFFSARLDSYEEHMMFCKRAYDYMAQIIPAETKSILDLGCGTGLEIDAILAAKPDVSFTGIDLSPAMLSRLRKKHPRVKAICADYFEYDFCRETFDTVISFESLHHFKPAKKRELFEKIRSAMPPDAAFIEADYIACCEKEETLLMEECERRRRRENIPDDVFVHFDTPLTAEHETELLKNAGFRDIKIPDCIDGACFIVCKK